MCAAEILDKNDKAYLAWAHTKLYLNKLFVIVICILNSILTHLRDYLKKYVKSFVFFCVLEQILHYAKNCIYKLLSTNLEMLLVGFSKNVIIRDRLS